MNKPSESQSTTESIKENKPLIKQKRNTSIPAQITNITSPKNNTFNKMLMPSINFSNNTISSKFNLK